MIPAIDGIASSVGYDDPLRCRVPLPLIATYYPIGFPLEMATNSEELLAAASELWRAYPRLSCSKPVRLHVEVEGRSNGAAGEPVVRGREHLVFITQSRENFAVADLSRGFAYAALTHEMAADRRCFRYYYLEPLVHLMIDSLHATPLHAACVALPSGAVVLCGASGVGKTSLAYACARRGWIYLSDDATHVLRRSSGHTVAGRPHQIRFRASAGRLFPELNAFPGVTRPNGKCNVEVDTVQLGISTAYRAEARAIVFLQRRGDPAKAEAAAFPREKAKQILQQVLCYGDERTRKQQLGTLGDFLNLPVVDLSYYDMDEAEGALRRLVT